MSAAFCNEATCTVRDIKHKSGLVDACGQVLLLQNEHGAESGCVVTGFMSPFLALFFVYLKTSLLSACNFLNLVIKFK